MCDDEWERTGGGGVGRKEMEFGFQEFLFLSGEEVGGREVDVSLSFLFNSTILVSIIA